MAGNTMILRLTAMLWGAGVLLSGCASSAPHAEAPGSGAHGNADMVTASAPTGFRPGSNEAPASPGSALVARGPAGKDTALVTPSALSTENAPAGHQLSAAELQFAREVATRHAVPLNDVVVALDQAQRNATVLRLMAPPPPPADAPRRQRHWPGYRDRFVESVRINAGLDFWQAHADTLAEAERRYGVPAPVIVAILGVETVYGRVTGDFPVLDALYTLAFYWPDHARRDRSPYFRGELETYLVDAIRHDKEPRAARGSFAGAVGLPQFMPSSIRDYAVSTDAGEPPDLSNDINDVIFSVANYLAEHGWQPGLPVFVEASLPPDTAQWVDGGLEPTLRWSQLEAAGVSLRQPPMVGLVSAPLSRATLASRDPAVGIIDLEHANGPTEYRIATPNFFAITQYNRSYFYASAVADLAQALEARRQGE